MSFARFAPMMSVLAEELDAARFELGWRGHAAELPGKIILDLPRTISPTFSRAFSARIVERSTNSFEFWLRPPDEARREARERRDCGSRRRI